MLEGVGWPLNVGMNSKRYRFSIHNFERNTKIKGSSPKAMGKGGMSK
jgi:hypothetical protein